MKILVLDNYDSFTYNLVHAIRHLAPDATLDVFRNDEIELDAVAAYDKIVLSPGPGIPEEAGIMPALILRYGSKKSILGVCLGHQAIGEAYGAKLHNMDGVLHGVSSLIRITDKRDPLFEGVENPFEGAHYHSWIVSGDDFPDTLVVTAEDRTGLIMAMRHRDYDLTGVQFHPESVLTLEGEKMIKNWLNA